jgi:hypothetical protein
MSLRYTHTLIPTSLEFTPTPAQVQTYLEAMLTTGVIGGEPMLTLRTPSGRTREARNPFTGDILSSVLRSMSDLHEESGGPPGVPDFGDKCADSPQRGFFTNPHTMQLIKVPKAGCARFWVEFDLGNSVFPPMDDERLDILDPEVVREAENIFGRRFVQGCQWG